MIRFALSDAKLRRSIRLDYDHSPLIVFYEVTRACDLVCTHCRACSQTAPHPDELSPELSLRLIDQLVDFPKPPMLVLTGGDPFKRSDIFDLIAHGCSLGLNVSITLAPRRSSRAPRSGVCVKQAFPAWPSASTVRTRERTTRCEA